MFGNVFSIPTSGVVMLRFGFNFVFHVYASFLCSSFFLFSGTFPFLELYV